MQISRAREGERDGDSRTAKERCNDLLAAFSHSTPALNVTTHFVASAIKKL
jgi:hypothetical protein